MPFLPQILVGMCLAIVLPEASAAEPMPDLSKLDRSVLKQSTYVAKRPLYGLAVFGTKADKPVWLVLDKSKPDAKEYDVLHLGGDRHTRSDGSSFDIGSFI